MECERFHVLLVLPIVVEIFVHRLLVAVVALEVHILVEFVLVQPDLVQMLAVVLVVLLVVVAIDQ